MTEMLIAPADLTQYEAEFSIPCEWPACREQAVVMAKGCSSKRHFSMCSAHLAERREWFHAQGRVICDGCNRPFIFFETHYDLVGI